MFVKLKKNKYFLYSMVKISTVIFLVKFFQITLTPEQNAFIQLYIFINTGVYPNLNCSQKHKDKVLKILNLILFIMLFFNALFFKKITIDFNIATIFLSIFLIFLKK